MILETVVVGAFEVNSYILASSAGSQAIIIDPGSQEAKIKGILAKHRLQPAFIINTHGHIDHIGSDDCFGVSVYVHRNDKDLLLNPKLNLSSFLTTPFSVKSKIKVLEDEEVIILEDLELEVLHTPGHTPGGVSLLLKKPKDKIIFSGDTLFCQGIGRTDFAGADSDTLIESIKTKLLVLPDDTLVLPGHGPSSSIGKEKTGNPFLNEHA
jgi:glyoxylase-like metal-dependent hydrolase (beta-lactamase superfamily II)